MGPWRVVAPMRAPCQLGRSVDRPVLCLVADGMGGQAAGERASALAAEGLAGRAPGLDGADAIRRALREVNRDIFEASEADEGLRGMGTTVAGCLFGPDAFHWFNVGDSRIYRYRDGFARRLSVDDVPDRTERRSSIITQSLGGSYTLEEIEPHIGREPVTHGWSYLLCSDGLTDLVDDSAIEHVLASGGEDTALVTQLFDWAMEAGGHDNISIMLVRITAAKSFRWTSAETDND